MSSQIHPGARPLTGAYYWVPKPGDGSVVWDLVTCHDLKAWKGISHREFWPLILPVLSQSWGKELRTLDLLQLDHHTGLPRGRVSHPQTRYAVIHGDDAPPEILDWLDLVKARFHLNGVGVASQFIEHEKMLGDDLHAVQEALGIRLG